MHAGTNLTSKKHLFHLKQWDEPARNITLRSNLHAFARQKHVYKRLKPMLLAPKGHQQRVHLDINKQNNLYINNIQTSPFSAYLRMDASLFVYTQIISRIVVKIIDYSNACGGYTLCSISCCRWGVDWCSERVIIIDVYMASGTRTEVYMKPRQ